MSAVGKRVRSGVIYATTRSTRIAGLLAGPLGIHPMLRSSLVSKIPLLVVGSLLAVAMPGMAAHAQLPGLPVLQNGFSNPGVTAGANYGTEAGARGYAIAGAWAPPNGRFQLSAGIGGYDLEEGDTWLAYGGRFAMPLTGITGNGRFGIAPFAGIGGANRDESGLVHVPVGVAAGYRFALGQTRAVSVYLTPFYSW